jgi:hypothetical protein
MQKQCELFRSEAKILSAEVYYGTASLVAKQQVDSLVSLTEDQLKALAARTKILVRQIAERKSVRGQIALELHLMQEDAGE